MCTMVISTPTWQNTILGQFKVILEREIQACKHAHTQIDLCGGDSARDDIGDASSIPSVIGLYKTIEFINNHSITITNRPLY